MRAHTRALTALALAGLLACGSSSPVEPEIGVSAIAFGGTLRLSNRSDVTVFYTIIDPAILPLWDYAPCTSKSSGCRWLDPHSQATLSNAEMLGHPTALDEVMVVSWWREVIGGDGVITHEGRVRVALK